MPRFSEPVAFTKDNITKLGNDAGIYEIGSVRSGEFNPRYLGMSESSMKARLLAHLNGRGNSNVKSYLEEAIRNHLQFRTCQRENPKQTEAQWLQAKGIGEEGFYKYNRRYEKVD